MSSSENDNHDDADKIMVKEEVEKKKKKNPEFHVEGLSQDIIEWDESNNVDLRTLYPSPFAIEIRETTTTDDSNISKNPSNIPARWMNAHADADADADGDDSARVNLNRTFQDVSLQNERDTHEQRRQERLAGAVKEIDGIFDILQMEENIREASRTFSSTLHDSTDHILLTNTVIQLWHCVNAYDNECNKIANVGRIVCVRVSPTSNLPMPIVPPQPMLIWIRNNQIITRQQITNLLPLYWTEMNSQTCWTISKHPTKKILLKRKFGVSLYSLFMKISER
jgi:hypothetical protein